MSLTILDVHVYIFSEQPKDFKFILETEETQESLCGLHLGVKREKQLPEVAPVCRMEHCRAVNIYNNYNPV